MEILVLCTANICRSPMGEALLRRRAAGHGELRVSSAGFLRAGLPPAPEVVEVMAARGLDVSEHRSRTVTRELLEPVDLLIGMTREHVREAVLLRPGLLSRSFTLKELVRRTGELGTRTPGEPLEEWLLRAQHDRSPMAFMGSSRDDDVEDPYGRRFQAYKSSAAEIDELVGAFVELAWGAVEPAGEP